MTTIRLHPPVGTSDRLERLNLFPGRHLGQDELKRTQDYADERLASLLATAPPGIVRGLEVDLPAQGTAGEGCSVRPGLAVAGNGRALGLFYPTQASWRGLVEAYLRESGEEGAAGIYYLVLRRSYALVDADQGLDPCRRGELDPRRDTRIATLGTLALRRLAVPSGRVGETPEGVQNRIAASQADAAFLPGLADAVPLALLSVSARQPPPESPGSPGVGAFAYRVDWLSEAAGRYLAIPDSGYHALLAHTQSVLQSTLAQALAQDPEDGPVLGLADFLEARLRLAYLPAAGVLPSFLLEAQDARAPDLPRLRWLPRHLAVDMVPVPEESIPDLIERHLARRVIDLSRPNGDRIRLLLAVNEPDYRPDLLDVPQVDGVLLADLYRYHQRAQDAWFDRQAEHQTLYRVGDSDVLTQAQIAALDLPQSPARPPLPHERLDAMVQQAWNELDPNSEVAPYPYGEPRPEAPAYYLAWLERLWQAYLAAVPRAERTPGPPPPIPTQGDGLVLRYRVSQLQMESVDSRIRELRSRLEKTRDYVLLQRQQLDSQTVSLAALAGGVAGDGSGLQVARWLPFTELKGLAIAEEAPQSFALSGFTASAAVSAQLASGVSAFQLASAATSAPTAAVARAVTATTQSVATKGLPIGSVLNKAYSSKVELGIARDRLDRLKDAPRQAITKPALDSDTRRFGVLDHIRPEVPEYRRAFLGMTALLRTLESLFSAGESGQIRTALNALGVPIAPERISDSNAWGTDWAEVQSLDVPGRLYHALFKAGQTLTRQIAFMEDRYNGIEDELEAELLRRAGHEDTLDKLAAQIEGARQRLDGLEGRRLERLGDYGVAQSLVREDWAAVHRSNLERSRVLTRGLKGLYYVRELSTPLGLRLTDPLELRHGSAGDPVPGCDWDREVDVPESLLAFFDSVLEVPMADWRVLKPLTPRLPPPVRLAPIWDLRRFRFGQIRTGVSAPTPAPGLASRLAQVTARTRSVFDLWAQAPVPAAESAASLARYQEESARVLSLKDLLTSGPGGLQREVQQLHDRLEQCIVCLLDRLGRVQPSLRLDWAQRAEDDRLDVERVQTWPGLERAEALDLEAVRTTADLVDWWFRQLDPEASANGREAMRAMQRAALIVSALGDPTEIVKGEVSLPPRHFAVGEPLRLALSRQAQPGTRLQILDEMQRVVGLVSVEDQDGQGVLARVERVDDLGARPSTKFTVLASRATSDFAAASAGNAGISAAERLRLRTESWRRGGLG